MADEINEMYQTAPPTPVILDKQPPFGPPAEPKVETPAPTAETPAAEEKKEELKPFVEAPQKTVAPLDTPPAVEAKAPSFFDKLETKKEAPAPAAAPAIDPDIQAKLDRLAQIEQNPIIKLATGKYDLTKVGDVQKFLRDAAGEDYTNASNELLLRKSFEKEGLTGDVLKEAVEETLAEKFSEAVPAWKQEIERKKLLEGVTRDQTPGEIIKTLTEIQSAQGAQTNPADDFLATVQAEVQNTVAVFNDWAKESIGQEFHGYVLTEDDAKALPQGFVDRANEFDPKRSFIDQVKIATYEKAVEAAEARGYEKAMREKANPSRNDTTSNIIMPRTGEEGLGAATKEDLFAQANARP